MSSEFIRTSRLKFLSGAGTLALLTAGLSGPALAQAAEQPVAFNIEQQSLADALKSYGVAADRQVMFAVPLVRGKTANAVSGEMTPSEALDKILDGSGLVYERTSSDVLVIKTAQRQAAIGRPFRVAQVNAASSREEIVEPDNEEESALVADTIIVTGTNIRGIAPESSPTIVFDREAIDRSGFLTTDEFIRSIPQNFGGGANNVTPFGVPDSLEANFNNVLAAGVNIRGLDAGSTLTLLNGRRLSPAGENGAFVDVSSIPLSAVERIEVLTDGASSIYGGDAVAGVVNFVLSEDFEGAETSLTYGKTTEGNRNEFRVNQLLGTSWGSGNGFISYEYVNQDILLASEKDFSEDAPAPLSLLPGQERHSVIAYITQELRPNLEFNVSAYYADRFSDSIFNRDDADRPVRFEDAASEQFVIAPMISYDVGGADWRLVLAGDYSKTIGRPSFQDRDKLTGVLEPAESQRNEAAQTSVDFIADGPLFEIAGGPVKLAAGGAFRAEAFEFTGVSGIVSVDSERDVWAGFGELFVPIVSKSNALPLLRRLEVNASVRYDDYSDFGGSTNPKFGLLWSPMENLLLRASYSTSFNPPDLGLIGKPDTAVGLLPTLNPENNLRDIQYLIVFGTDGENLGPEESETFTAGFDYTDQVFGGELSISSSYYNITFDERVGSVPTPFGSSTLDILATLDQFPSGLVTFSPSRAVVDALIEDAESTRGFTDVVAVLGDTPSDLNSVAFILDIRSRNLASTKTDGIDFDVVYSRGLGLGELTLGIAGNYILDFTDQATSSSPRIEGFNRIFNPVDFRGRGSISWSSDDFTASAFVNYTDGYINDRVDPFVSVASWTTVDVNLGYRFRDRNGPVFLEGTRISVSMRNLFDQDPPFVKSDSGFAVSFFDGTNANPLGRFVSVNLVKSW